MEHHILDGKNTCCLACGFHKDCPACEKKTPPAECQRHGHVWQELKVVAQ